jgi:NarL family two-component system response regulator LiaR
VLALTGYVQDSTVQDSTIKHALQAGVAGFLLKSVSLDELMSAIHGVLAGQIILSPQVAEALLQTPRAEQGSDYGLTEREREVLQLMTDGLSNNAIAERLHVSPMTVKSHVSSVLSKMNAATRGEAVARAMRQNLFH